LGREACVPIFLAGRRHGVRRRPSSPAPALRCFTIVAQERPQDLGYGYSKFSMAKKNFFDSLIYKFRAHNSLLIYHKQNKIKATTIHWGQNCLLYVSPTGDLPKSFIVVQKNN